MSNTNKNSLADPDLWVRLIYMVVFGLLSWVARLVIILIAVIQFILVLFTGKGNANLQALGDGTAQWTCQAFRFLCFASEQKPYPFQDWPAAPVAAETAMAEGETRPPVAPQAASAGVKENDDGASDSGQEYSPGSADSAQWKDGGGDNKGA